MDEKPSPLEKLTLTGRMLLVAHVLLGVGGLALYICDFIPQFPPGRYPLLMFVVPVGLACFFLFLILAWLLEKLGVNIYKS